ncbi:hypothetical protein DPMN_072469 [Dreissena polymorpha]|uniref:Uncharacterized protein n=1 Tax=Dreissena polymorpha TaxID=45954 RepID=A0A9D4BWT8_DREPO|nr:hypothetical protein DPMN_072469 [Dreissena polymorpha]
MIYGLGGSLKVNNFLSALDMKEVDPENLKLMENRAGEIIEAVAKETAKDAGQEKMASETSSL